VVETVAHGAVLTRQLVVFNDTFAGTDVDVAWELRIDAPTGPVSDQGTMRVSIPLGQRLVMPITVRAPATGTRTFLVLQSTKDGQVLFRDDSESFTLQ
jgi:hypothetical protein